MSPDRDTTRIVRSWLEEGVTTLPDRVLDGVLDQLPATRQRRSVWRGLTSLNPGRNAQLAAAAAIVVIAVFGVELVPAFFPSIGGTPSASPGQPSPSPAATRLPNPTVEGALSPGRHSLRAFAVPGISFEVPEGWGLCLDTPDESILCSDREIGVSFVIVQNVVVGGCASGRELRSPPIGPSVDNLVAALLSLKGITTTRAVDISIDGFQGKALNVSAGVPPTCAIFTWASSEHTNGLAADETNIVRIVDVNGTRLLIAGNYQRLGAGAGEASAAVRQVLDSIHIAR